MSTTTWTVAERRRVMAKIATMTREEVSAALVRAGASPGASMEAFDFGRSLRIVGDPALESLGEALVYNQFSDELIKQQAGVYRARFGAAAVSNASCRNCGAPWERVCSYCGTEVAGA